MRLMNTMTEREFTYNAALYQTYDDLQLFCSRARSSAFFLSPAGPIDAHPTLTAQRSHGLSVALLAVVGALTSLSELWACIKEPDISLKDVEELRAIVSTSGDVLTTIETLVRPVDRPIHPGEHTSPDPDSILHEVAGELQCSVLLCYHSVAKLTMAAKLRLLNQRTVLTDDEQLESLRLSQALQQMGIRAESGPWESINDHPEGTLEIMDVSLPRKPSIPFSTPHENFQPQAQDQHRPQKSWGPKVSAPPQHPSDVSASAPVTFTEPSPGRAPIPLSTHPELTQIQSRPRLQGWTPHEVEITSSVATQPLPRPFECKHLPPTAPPYATVEHLQSQTTINMASSGKLPAINVERNKDVADDTPESTRQTTSATTKFAQLAMSDEAPVEDSHGVARGKKTTTSKREVKEDEPSKVDFTQEPHFSELTLNGGFNFSTPSTAAPPSTSSGFKPIGHLESYILRPHTEISTHYIIWSTKIELLLLDEAAMEAHMNKLGPDYSVIDAMSKLLPEQMRLIQECTKSRHGSLVAIQEGKPVDMVSHMGTFPIKPIIFMIQTRALPEKEKKVKDDSTIIPKPAIPSSSSAQPGVDGVQTHASTVTRPSLPSDVSVFFHEWDGNPALAPNVSITQTTSGFFAQRPAPTPPTATAASNTQKPFGIDTPYRESGRFFVEKAGPHDSGEYHYMTITTAPGYSLLRPDQSLEELRVQDYAAGRTAPMNWETHWGASKAGSKDSQLPFGGQYHNFRGGVASGIFAVPDVAPSQGLFRDARPDGGLSGSGGLLGSEAATDAGLTKPSSPFNHLSQPSGGHSGSRPSTGLFGQPSAPTQQSGGSGITPTFGSPSEQTSTSSAHQPNQRAPFTGFGATNKTGGLFGQPRVPAQGLSGNPPPAPRAVSPFGAPVKSPVTGPVSASCSITPKASLFGQPAINSSRGLFSTPRPATQSTNSFGTASATSSTSASTTSSSTAPLDPPKPNATPTSGVFATTAAKPPPSAYRQQSTAPMSGLFSGGFTPSAPSTWAGFGSTSAPTTAVTGLSGSAAPASAPKAATTSGLFGSTAPVFAPKAATTSGLFGSTPASAPKTAPASGLFGSGATASTPKTTPTAGLFSSVPTSVPAPPTSGLFGGSTPASAPTPPTSRNTGRPNAASLATTAIGLTRAASAPQPTQSTPPPASGTTLAPAPVSVLTPPERGRSPGGSLHNAPAK